MGEEVVGEGEGDIGGVDGRGEVETYGIALIQCVRSRKRRQLRVMIRPRLSVGARYQIRVTMYQLEAGVLLQPDWSYIRRRGYVHEANMRRYVGS